MKQRVTKARITKAYLYSQEVAIFMNLGEISKAHSCCEQAAEQHPKSEEVPEIHPLGYVTAANVKINTQTNHRAKQILNETIQI